VVGSGAQLVALLPEEPEELAALVLALVLSFAELVVEEESLDPLSELELSFVLLDELPFDFEDEERLSVL
jgi:hypothetical protein